jgi:hypothetical protein
VEKQSLSGIRRASLQRGSNAIEVGRCIAYFLLPIAKYHRLGIIKERGSGGPRSRCYIW